MNASVCLYCYMCGLIRSIGACCVVLFFYLESGAFVAFVASAVVPKLNCDRTLLLIQSYPYILYGGESSFIPLHSHAVCDFSPKQFWPQEQHNRCRAGIAQFPIPNKPYGFCGC